MLSHKLMVCVKSSLVYHYCTRESKRACLLFVVAVVVAIVAVLAVVAVKGDENEVAVVAACYDAHHQVQHQWLRTRTDGTAKRILQTRDECCCFVIMRSHYVDSRPCCF